MEPSVSAFIARHAASDKTLVAELLQAIHEGAVALKSLSNDVSSQELARTYLVRSHNAESKGQHALAAELRALAEQCESSAPHPCSVWAFEGGTFSYAAFELQPSQAIAACFRFNGPLSAPEQNDA